MKISTRSEYGIRVLLALARAEDQEPLSLTTIARSERLPHAYLEQLVADLRRGGLVTATRGQAGGYRLARPPEQISLATAIRTLDGPLLEMPCAGVESAERCDRREPCSVHEAYERLFASIDSTLGTTSLAELAEQAANAGGPPYSPDVRRRIRAAAEATATAQASAQSQTLNGAS
ncbi:MAG TPA: Rrf2 family transcriptional regulator [Candidatus Limnocylindria bacterium]|nr:Rrf2 family transcriptional regulator [Candidatus Limnocylindria bacterium]